MSQENVESVHRAADALNRRDLDAFLSLLDAAVEVRPLQVGLEGGGYRGHEGVRRWWQDVFAVSPDFTVEVTDVRDLGDVTITKFQARGHGAGSDILLEQTLWAAARWRGNKALWTADYATEAEALEAAGLRE